MFEIMCCWFSDDGRWAEEASDMDDGSSSETKISFKDSKKIIPVALKDSFE